MGDADCLRFELVPAASVDALSIATLVNDAFRTHAIMPGDRTSAEGVREEAGTRGEFLQLSRGANLVGSAMIKPASDTTAEDRALWAARGAELESALYFGLAAVDPVEMRSGVGSRLVTEAERIARERCCQRIVLGTVREFGLVPYYARFGFRVVSEQSFPEGHWGLTAAHSYCDMAKEL
jgi:GNAT superfamily N-acetyltransferase